jgi:hypothetical protein
MSAWESLVGKGIDQLRRRLDDGDEANAVASRLRTLNFPALLGLAGTGAGSEAPVGPELLREAARHLGSQLEIAEAGISVDAAERLLGALLLHRASPAALVEDEALRRRVLVHGVKGLAAGSRIDLSDEEAQRIATLLETGRFFEDAGAATAAILFTVRGMPIALVQDVQDSPLHLIELTLAMARDLAGARIDVVTVLTDLLDGSLDQPPGVLDHTLRALYRFASAEATVRTVHELLGNETVRAAIVLYARSNGVDVQPKDLDTLRQSVFNADDPDLGPAFAVGWERLKEGHGADRALAILGRLRQARFAGSGAEDSP